MNKNSNIYIAGHTGMVGSAIFRLLKSQGYENLIVKSRQELDLKNTNAVADFFAEYKPETVILAAAKVGGINANMSYPVEFLLDNLIIQNNIIQQSHLNKVKKVVFLGSSCIYPKECPQPMKEEYLLTERLEPTNEGYALAKITGLKLLEYYKKQYGLDSISLMPCNLYGPNDSFDLQHSHVLSALVKRFIDARDEKIETITLWGTGIARREFMHVSDVAEAILFMINNLDTSDFINIGWGDDISIKELAELIAYKVKYAGNIEWDSAKPNGMLRKCMDVSKMKQSGFYPKITLEQGIDEMIELYQSVKYN